MVYGFYNRIFTSQDALRDFVAGFGVFGAAAFILFQAVQVVVPILPGGLGCLAGVLLFGPWLGFTYNYADICRGSIVAFLLAKVYGRPLLTILFQEKTIRKYETWSGKNFSKWFALTIFFPVVPDDFICWLAVITPMRLKRFCAIILLGKPTSIALYSLSLHVAFRWGKSSGLFTSGRICPMGKWFPHGCTCRCPSPADKSKATPIRGGLAVYFCNQPQQEVSKRSPLLPGRGIAHSLKGLVKSLLSSSAASTLRTVATPFSTVKRSSIPANGKP